MVRKTWQQQKNNMTNYNDRNTTIEDRQETERGGSQKDLFSENAFQLDAAKDKIQADIQDYNRTGTSQRVTDYLLSDKAKEGADASTLANLYVKQDQLQNAGSVKYIIGRVGNSIHIHLKAVDLKPRDEKDACNFKISVLLLPNQKGTSPFNSKKQPNVYDQKKDYAFELEDPDNVSSYHFQFDLEENEDEDGRRLHSAQLVCGDATRAAIVCVLFAGVVRRVACGYSCGLPLGALGLAARATAIAWRARCPLHCTAPHIAATT